MQEVIGSTPIFSTQRPAYAGLFISYRQVTTPNYQVLGTNTATSIWGILIIPHLTIIKSAP